MTKTGNNSENNSEFEILILTLQCEIKKLEERIIALEKAESVVHILPSDNYYWEHG